MSSLLDMVSHNNKRRKLVHSRPEATQPSKDKISSLASSNLDEHDVSSTKFDHGDDTAANTQAADGTSDQDISESEMSQGSDNGIKSQENEQTAPGRPNGARNKVHRQKPGSDLMSGAYNAGTFKSSFFKMQVDELLEQIRPRRGKVEKAAEEALHRLKSTIESISDHEPLSIADVENRMLRDKICIPFPNPRPSKDAKYKLVYSRPASINVVGSYALKTSPRTKHGFELDMVVVMPPSLFTEKDILNYRYFYRRSYYLACIAAALKASLGDQYQIQYKNWHDNPLKPILALRPASNGSDANAKTVSDWTINIVPCVVESTFPREKLHLDRGCIRTEYMTRENLGEGESGQRVSSPFYNSSIRSDMLVTSYLKTLHAAANDFQSFRDACLLGCTWLRQRSFSSSIQGGGFGSFEWISLIALLFQGGGSADKPLLSDGYSSYQILKAVLQLLAARDWSRSPLVVGPDPARVTSFHDGTPFVWDGHKAHNLLYKMTAWSYKLLRQEARTTVRMLGDQQFDPFDATFILLLDDPLYRFDSILELGDSSKLFTSTFDDDPLQKLRSLHQTLQKALRDRVSLINITKNDSRIWDVSYSRPTNRDDRVVRIGFLVNAAHVDRTIDHGPSAENKSDAAAFREFWGEKAELRRFKDGSIMESLIWSSKDDDQPVLEQILRFAMDKFYPSSVQNSRFRFIDNGFRKVVPYRGSSSAFNKISEAYTQFENDLRGLPDLPLSIRSIVPADSQLRHTSISVPMNNFNPLPADVVVQFEGSGKWPDDIVAIQRTKIAFLVKISELLEESPQSITARIGLENEDFDTQNQAYLDVKYDSGAVFRARIHQDRQQTLFERQLKDKNTDARSREIAAIGLAKFKRDYVKTPAHTQAIARLCSRHPALSGTIRVMKQWFASHLLANHIADEVIELIAVHTFIQPWPWQTPSSVQTGVLRTLFKLARWDWRTEPLIVDLSGEDDTKSDIFQAAKTNFESWRKIDPSMNRIVLFVASSVDVDGTTWTDGKPIKVVASRMTALARASVAEINEKGTLLNWHSIFVSSPADFDFTIHINTSFASGGNQPGKSRANSRKFKNLEIDSSQFDDSLVGFDAVQGFLREIENTFNSAILFFSGGQARPIIAGLWLPHTASRVWRLNVAYSTVPKHSTASDEVTADVNRGAILAEISRLGGDLIERIDVKDPS